MGHNTWIDVSAAPPTLVPCVVDWAVREDVEILSDHRMIITQLVRQLRRLEVHIARDWCRVEWDKFMALLLQTLDKGLFNRSLTNLESIEGAVASMTDSIQRVIDALVPLKRVCCYSWAGWTPELMRL